MQNDINDRTIYMNIMPTPAPFSASKLGPDEISAILDKNSGTRQLLGLRHSILCNQTTPLPSNSSKPEVTTNEYFSTVHHSCAVSKALDSPPLLRATEPSVLSYEHQYIGVNNNSNSMEVNNSDNSFQWFNDALSKKVFGSFVEGDLSRDVKDEMTYSVCSLVDRPLDHLIFSVAPTVDIDSLWNNDTTKMQL